MAGAPIFASHAHRNHLVRQPERPAGQTEIAERHVAEDQPAHAGSQPVGAYNQVVGVFGGVAEHDAHGLAGLFDGVDSRPHTQRAFGDAASEDIDERGAFDEVPGAKPFLHGCEARRVQNPPVASANLVRCRAHGRGRKRLEETHAFQDVGAGWPQDEHVTHTAIRFGLFHDLGFHPALAHQCRQRESRNTAADDQHPQLTTHSNRCWHPSPSLNTALRRCRRRAGGRTRRSTRESLDTRRLE